MDGAQEHLHRCPVVHPNPVPHPHPHVDTHSEQYAAPHLYTLADTNTAYAASHLDVIPYKYPAPDQYPDRDLDADPNADPDCDANPVKAGTILHML